MAYNGVARTLVDQALTAVADGSATDNQRLIVILHAESQETRDTLCRVMRDESERTRRELHRDIESAETEGITIFGRRFNRSTLLITLGLSLGLNGLEAIGLIALAQQVFGG